MSAYITEIEYTDRFKWNAIVKSFCNYEVFYLNEYTTAFMKEDIKNGTPILLLYERGNERAINVVFKRDIANDPQFEKKLLKEKYYDIITPYGYGGFWGDIKDYEQLYQEYNNYCRSNDYICEFVRFELFSDAYKFYDGKIESQSHNVIRNLKNPVEEIWMEFKQKVRKNVKRAIKNNLEILVENTDEHLQDFLNIYYSTMERCDADTKFYFSDKFFESLISMKENIMFFYVLSKGKVISTELVIYGAENAYSYLGGTYKEYFELRPNDFLKFEIIKWAHDRGLKNFVLGGGYGHDDGIFQYKSCFAPKGIYDFYIGKKIFDLDKYNELCGIRGISVAMESLDTGFFPKYREKLF